MSLHSTICNFEISWYWLPHNYMLTTHNSISLLSVTILRQLYLSLITVFLILESGMIKNKKKISDSKTEYIVIRFSKAKPDLGGLSFSVGDNVIVQSSNVKDFGVIFDQFLNFDDYIGGLCRSTHFYLRNIGRIRHMLSYDACAQLIHVFISIHLDYCNSLLYNLPKSSIERWQKIQNRTSGILTRNPRCDDIREVLVSLHSLKTEQRIIFKILILTFNAIDK